MTLTFFLTFFTLLAFAANSIFCRMALMSDSIGPLEFTAVRLLSGILILAPVIVLSRKQIVANGSEALIDTNPLAIRWPNIAPSLFLFSYALFFSLAYIELEAGIGALILFASVQITMMGISVFRGNRVTSVEWAGFALAFFGLVYLLMPGLSAPSPVGTIMMILSGVSWGVYSLMGKNQKQPILTTARNFLFCLPGCLLLVLLIAIIASRTGPPAVQSRGIILAVLSGALSSGLGYVLWYVSLRRISTTVASIAQLSVPILAGIGGILFLSESISLRLVMAALLIVGGIVLAIAGKPKST